MIFDCKKVMTFVISIVHLVATIEKNNSVTYHHKTGIGYII